MERHRKCFAPSRVIDKTVYRNQRQTLTSSPGSSIYCQIPLEYTFSCETMAATLFLPWGLDLRLQNKEAAEIQGIACFILVWLLLSDFTCLQMLLVVITAHDCYFYRSGKWIFVLEHPQKQNTFGLLKIMKIYDYRNKHLNTARFLFPLLLMLHWRYCHAVALFSFLFLLSFVFQYIFILAAFSSKIMIAMQCVHK